MRIALAKPDYGVRGGFELVLERIAQRWEADGHEVRWLTPDVARLARRPFGTRVLDLHWEREPEFFRYMALVDVFRQLDTHWADVLVSGQPPSFVAHHPRHLCLFSHHHRLFYDLADLAAEAGLVDPGTHARATRHVRAVDQAALDRVGVVLAASPGVRQRLWQYNRIDAGVYAAGPGFRCDLPEPGADDRFARVLCVSRHEFPKRTELFVQAMRLVPDIPAVSVGGGGRLGWVKEIDRRCSVEPGFAAGPSRPLWACPPGPSGPPAHAGGAGSNVHFAGEVDAAALDGHYRQALCVVAPSYAEDYGLTALEAMAYGKPLVVCDDGGNLTRFVEPGITGLVVAPEAGAIANAVRRLAADPPMAARLGEAGRRRARAATWDRAMGDIDAGLATVMAGP